MADDNAMAPPRQNALSGYNQELMEALMNPPRHEPAAWTKNYPNFANFLRQVPLALMAFPAARVGPEFLRQAPLAMMALPARGPSALPSAAVVPKPPPRPVNPETGARYGAEPTPEFGSTEWARGLASKIENSPVWKQIGPATAGSYLASKVYDPIANGLGSAVDWWNDPNGPVVGQALRSQMSRHAPSFRPDAYNPLLPYFPEDDFQK